MNDRPIELIHQLFSGKPDQLAIVVAGWLGEYASREPKAPTPN